MFLFMYMYACIFIFVYICIYKYSYIYIFIYTYIGATLSICIAYKNICIHNICMNIRTYRSNRLHRHLSVERKKRYSVNRRIMRMGGRIGRKLRRPLIQIPHMKGRIRYIRPPVVLRIKEK
jgi:hypothetical protein